MMLKSPTWILPAKSGSSLIAKIPRLARGSSPKCMVSSSESRCPPRAALLGSTSPMISAMVTSGVAWLPRDARLLGSFGHELAAELRDRRERVVVHFAAGEDGDLFVEQRHQLTQDAALRLPAQPEQDEVVAGEDRVHELRDHGVLVAHDAGKQGRAVLEQTDQVLPHLVLHRAMDAGVARPLAVFQFAQRGRLVHGSIVNRPPPAV